MWCSGSAVLLDCIDFRALSPYLLTKGTIAQGGRFGMTLIYSLSLSLDYQVGVLPSTSLPDI